MKWCEIRNTIAMELDSNRHLSKLIKDIVLIRWILKYHQLLYISVLVKASTMSSSTKIGTVHDS